jgi:hypothetical protein
VGADFGEGGEDPPEQECQGNDKTVWQIDADDAVLQEAPVVETRFGQAPRNHEAAEEKEKVGADASKKDWDRNDLFPALSRITPGVQVPDEMNEEDQASGDSAKNVDAEQAGPDSHGARSRDI